jgi:hypothetical protein
MRLDCSQRLVGIVARLAPAEADGRGHPFERPDIRGRSRS